MTDDIENILKEYDLGDDFGFSSISEEEYNQAIEDAVGEAVTETESQIIKEYKEKLLAVEKLILPFLVKLMKTDETYIKWPPDVRRPVIKAQIERIVKLTRG